MTMPMDHCRDRRHSRCLRAAEVYVAVFLSSVCASIYAQSGTCDHYAFLTAQPAATVGSAVAGIGDLDGDGVPEIVGSDTLGPFGAGGVYIWSGANGALLHTIAGTANGDQFGYAVANVGDVDSDGVADLLVGAPAAPAGNGGGEATVISGINLAPIWQMSNVPSTGLLGWSVRGAGDVDADGVVDWIIGAPGDLPLGPTGTVNGHAHVVSGFLGSVIHSLQSPLIAPLTKAGWSVAGAGDVNGDGFDDVAYSTSAAALVGGSYEHVIIADGNSGTVIRVLSHGTGANTKFGTDSQSVANAGDLDGDGIDDLVVGDSFFGPIHAGASFAYSGSTGSLLRFIDGGLLSGGGFGRAVCAAGDMNSDGFGDYWVGGQGSKFAGDDLSSGCVFAISGSNGSLLAQHRGKEGTGVGYSVANIGDLDFDGVQDCAAGSIIGGQATPPLPSAVYVFVDACGAVTTVGTGCKKGANPVPTFEIDRGCFAPGGEIVAEMRVGLVSTTSLLVAGMPGPSSLIPGSGGCMLEVGMPVSFVPIVIPANATVYYMTKLPPGPYMTDIVAQLLVPYTQFGVPNLIASKGLRFSPP